MSDSSHKDSGSKWVAAIVVAVLLVTALTFVLDHPAIRNRGARPQPARPPASAAGPDQVSPDAEPILLVREDTAASAAQESAAHTRTPQMPSSDAARPAPRADEASGAAVVVEEGRSSPGAVEGDGAVSGSTEPTDG